MLQDLDGTALNNENPSRKIGVLLPMTGVTKSQIDTLSLRIRNPKHVKALTANPKNPSSHAFSDATC